MPAPTPTDLNFNDANPPAPPGRVNVKWLASAPTDVIAVNLNGVITNLTFRDVSASVPIAGAPTGAGVQVYKVPLAPTAPGNFIVAHGLPAVPAFIIIEMSSDGAIWLQQPTAFDATNLYLVASDPSIIGTALCFMSMPDVAIPLAPSAAGNFSVPHGMAATPQYAVVEMTSSGKIWFQSTPTDATNVNLVASDPGVTGNVYVWLFFPHIVVVTNITVALTPSAPGNFTVAHTLGVLPSIVIIRMKSTGAIWFQSPLGYDSSNLYLVASDGGIVGDAELWT